MQHHKAGASQARGTVCYAIITGLRIKEHQIPCAELPMGNALGQRQNLTLDCHSIQNVPRPQVL